MDKENLNNAKTSLSAISRSQLYTVMAKGKYSTIKGKFSFATIVKVNFNLG